MEKCSVLGPKKKVQRSHMSTYLDMKWEWFWVQNPSSKPFKGCGMGPWLVLVSLCFRENVVATCKSGSLLCSLDNLLQKNVIVLFFWKSNFKMALILKKGFFDLLFTFFSHQGKVTKIPSAHISLESHTYIHVFCSPYLISFALPILEKQNTNLSDTVSLWYESWCWFLYEPFWNNQ